MNKRKLVAAIDFGSDSARIIISDTASGETIAESSKEYPRWKEGKYCNSIEMRYRQHPQDYLDVLDWLFPDVLRKAGNNANQQIMGIVFDTTGSTVCPVDYRGVPLAFMDEFSDDPDAMFHLWKDHTAVSEAKEINDAFSKNKKQDYTQYQGTYSSEWFWAKILHTVRKNAKVREKAYTWVEHCDWIAALFAGKTDPAELPRCACGAGHKALWHSAFNGLPSKECLGSIDPYLANIYDRYTKKPVSAGTLIGKITSKFASRFGINPKAVIGAGSFDAHAGGVGAGISLHTMVKVVGTSTVDLLIELPEVLKDKNLTGRCGMAENSIVPQYVGLEMGQPAFGDTLAWFKNLIEWPIKNAIIPESVLPNEGRNRIQEYLNDNLLNSLENAAEKITNSDVNALDWFNGRRYPRLNETVKGAVTGLTLGVSAPEFYASLVRGNVFGSKHIYDSLIKAGVKIDRLICVGGIAKKSKYIMQMMSDVLEIPIMVCRENQCCARGAAIYASVAAGIFSNVESAQKVFCEPYKANYFPDPRKHKLYVQLYQKYLQLGEFVEFKLGEDQ